MTPTEFLRSFFEPDSIIVLTAINPEQVKGASGKDIIVTKSFKYEDKEDITAFINEYDGKWNLYFTMNPVIRMMDNKPSRTDIKKLNWLHVDVDPRVVHSPEELAEEQRRIEKLFTDNRPSNIPEPSVVVFSGSGYQAFWHLEDGIELDRTEEAAEDAKLWNMTLERAFQADSVHNIDRIMRLPGTMNVPNEKKMKSKGRTGPVRSSITKADFGLKYKLEESFIKAPPLQVPGERVTSGTSKNTVKVEISGNIAPLNEVSELWQHVPPGNLLPERYKTIIQLGHHPEEYDKPAGDRSLWVFDAVCGMVRANIPDEVIYAVLMDRDFRISDHIYDQKRPDRYVRRQIERAKEFSIDPMLEMLNSKYAVTRIDGKAVVIFEDRDDESGGQMLKHMSPFDFKVLYGNRKVVVGEDSNNNPKMGSAATWWLEHPNRREYMGGVYFKPLEVAPPDKYNLWQGFAYDEREGDLHEGYLNHIFENVCSSDQEVYDYLIKWMAHGIQKANEQGHVAVVLKGKPGVGKSFFAHMYGKLFGVHYKPVQNADHIFGRFNAHLADACVVFSDEAIWSGDKKNLSALKTIITEAMRITERKGMDANVSKNYVRLIMASNDLEVVNVQAHERRFLALEVTENKMQDSGYFKKIANDMEAGGFSSLLYYLNRVDLTDFDVRDVPKTQELHNQSNLSLGPCQEWWLQCLIDGQISQYHTNDDGEPVWEEACPKTQAYVAFTDYAKRSGYSVRNFSKTKMLAVLRETMPDLKMQQRIKTIWEDNPNDPAFGAVRKKQRVNCYLFPSLAEARKLFEARHGPQEWEELSTELLLSDTTGNSGSTEIYHGNETSETSDGSNLPQETPF